MCDQQGLESVASDKCQGFFKNFQFAQRRKFVNQQQHLVGKPRPRRAGFIKLHFLSQATNYLIDVEHGVILDVEATPAHRTAEVDSTKLTGTFKQVPDRADVARDINESMVVELYSR